MDVLEEPTASASLPGFSEIMDLRPLEKRCTDSKANRKHRKPLWGAVQYRTLLALIEFCGHIKKVAEMCKTAQYKKWLALNGLQSTIVTILAESLYIKKGSFKMFG